jgi:uncharacterized membrane protein YgaE (UPF0421/DUF939 family)
MNLKNLLSKMAWYFSPKVVNGLKTALACLIGYLLYLWTPLPQAQWIVITILVVMSAQTSIGSLFLKAKMRFWGTVCGALASSAIILISGGHPVGLAISLFVMTAIFAYIAGTPGDVSYLGTLGAVTVAIIILNPVANLVTVAERFSEIMLGIIISFLVSYLIFPVRSHTIFLLNLENTLIYLQEYFLSCFKELIPDLNTPLHDLNEKVLGIFSQQRRLIQETGLELGKKRKDKENFQRIMNAERRVYRGLNLIYYSLHATPSTRKLIQSLNGFEEFKNEASNHFVVLANKIKNKESPIEFNLKNYDVIMQANIPANLSDYPEVDITIVNTFLFSVSFFLAEFKKLHLEVVQIS